MVQELQVLRCFSCETFQSHIVKKTNKWECKICGAKQSVKQVYGRGTGKDCRVHTQKLNALRGQKEEIKSPNLEVEDQIKHEPIRRSSSTKHDDPSSPSSNCCFKTTSKWAEFMDEKITGNGQIDFIEEGIADNNTIFKTSKTKVLKRKTEEFFDEVAENYPCDFNLPVENNTMLSSAHPVEITKKFKFNNHLSIVNSHNACSSSRINDSDLYIQNEVTNPPKLVNFNKQNDSRSWGKWAEYLENKVETCPKNSLNSPDITSENPTTVFSLKSADRLEEEGGLCSIRSESEPSNSLISKYCSLEQNSLNYGIAPDKISERLSSDSFERETLIKKGVLSGFDQTSFNKFASHSNSRKISDQSFNLCLSSVHGSAHQKVTSNILSDVKGVDKINMREEGFIINSEFGKEVNDNVKPVNEPVQNSNTANLPIFEQNTDLEDTDFQLDF